MPEYRETNGIPICPFCQKPTMRELTPRQPIYDVHYPRIYDENGINVNKCVQTRAYKCLSCRKIYNVSDGKYVGLPEGTE